MIVKALVKFDFPNIKMDFCETKEIEDEILVETLRVNGLVEVVAQKKGETKNDKERKRNNSK